MNKLNNNVISAFILIAIAVTFLSFVSAASFSSSSVSNARYYSTTSTYAAPSGFSYQNLISGINAPENEEEFYDLMVTILPGGCKPMIVRSDLLEEQNVPVFCELTAVKINPGVDISKIARISVKNWESNPYISGVGFYPARAAIRSTSTLTGSPVANNIGYAVIVLKRTETENAMPSNITANLSAMFEYDAVNGFGIGVNEMYLPVMSDDEFTSRQKEYGFFNGAGYLRVDSMDQNTAVVSIYDSRNRRLFSQRLEKDKTSREFRIPTSIFSSSYESQAVTLTLKEITMPQTSAKIMVNDGSYVAYKNGKFADKCTLTNVVSSGGGTGIATVNCGGKTVTLEKKFNKINLLVNGAPGDYALGDRISALNNQITQNYYLVYAGNVPNDQVIGDKKTFIFLAKENGGSILTIEKSRQIAKDIESQINNMNKKVYSASLSKIKSSSLFSNEELILVYQGDEAKNKSGDDIGIKFKEAKFENAIFTSASGAEGYYNKAKNGYDDVESKFPNENNNYGALGDTNVSFGPLSLWSKYALASDLKQEKDVLEILSEIRNSYPNSKNMIKTSKGVDKTAEQLMAESDNLLSSDGASTFIEDQNLYLELVSVNEPAESEASVKLTYAGIMNSQTTPEPIVGPVNSETGEGVLKIGQKFSTKTEGFSLSVKNITSNNINISYYCTGKTEKYKIITESPNPIILEGCNVQITVGEINYNGADEKKSNVSLKVEGKRTITTGVNQGADLMNFEFVSPIKSDDGKAITGANVRYTCNGKTVSTSAPFLTGAEILDCHIKIIEVKESEITITYKLSSTISTPQKSSTETTIGTEPFTARMGEKFIDVGNGKVEVTLKSFTADKAIFTYSCNNSVSNRDIDIKLGNTEVLSGCENSQIRVDKINLKEVAKVELNPKIKGRIREANFTFSIGIEKRSDFLLPAPDEMNKQIKELDETISKWKNTTEKLGNLVKGMKAACLATSGALTLKNWATGLTGEAAARHEVMTRQGGWNDICKEEIAAKHYTTENECFQDKNSAIEKSVEETTKLMQAYQKAEEARIKANKNATKGVTDYNKVKEDQLNTLRSLYSGEINVLGQDGSQKKMDIGKILQDMNLSEGDASSVDLRELELNLQLVNSNVDDSLKKSASKKVESLLSQFKSREQDHVYTDALSKKLDVPVVSIGNKNTQEYPYTKQTWSQIKDKFSSTVPNELKDTDLVVRIRSQQPIKDQTTGGDTPNNVDYLIRLTSPTKTDEKVHADRYYKIVDDAGGKSKIETLNSTEEANRPTNFVFKIYDSATLKNPCKNCDYVEVFNSEPYKGYPSLLPFDDKEGWYVSIRQSPVGFGNLKSYQDSGALSSFYLCNVGENGMIEGDSIDPCENFNINTADANVPFSGLTLSETRTKLSAANSAIRSAQDQLAKNPSAEYITIKGVSKPLKVKGVQGTAGGKCTDFMSPQDCNIMFNVCDPVVCPSSRCDMGGNYRVDNVIQSGIIGSIALCLPNIKEGIFIPICLTGIHAGMEGWISIMQAHRDCLNESLTTNKTIGICDEIYSVYQCDFMWKQIGPYANALAKNALSGTLFGAGTKGGGEYMFVNQAFSNMENSWQYFTSSYASDSSLSFGARSFSEIGSDVCKAKLSATYPNELAAAIEPDSPVQIYAFFDETSYTDATVPPTSSYKVYYHIFAGNDQGRYYQVYLRSSASSFGVTSRGYSNVASGYIAKGETIDQTRDFLDNSGFKELCVRIDTKDYCGFKSVTTDFAINYAKDKSLQDQANNKVRTEADCVSGSASIGALLTPNIQQGVEQVISPELYNQGIVRVCSSQNPGASVNPGRWSEVGYCDNDNIKCWVDGNSVQNAIQGKGIENLTLQQIEALNIQQMIDENNGLTREGGDDFIKNNMTKNYPLLDPITGTFTSSTYANMEKDISAAYNKMIFSSQKAALLYYQAMVYDRIARLLGKQKTADNQVISNPTLEDPLDIKEIVIGESANQGIAYVNALKIAYIESGLRQIDAPSSAGALGVMQVTSIALQDVNNNKGILGFSTDYSQNDLLSAQRNVEVGVRYLKLLEYYLDNYDAFEGLSVDKEAIVVASYNAGFQTVISAIGKAVAAGESNPYSKEGFSKYLPTETQNYLINYYSDETTLAIGALTTSTVTTENAETTETQTIPKIDECINDFYLALDEKGVAKISSGDTITNKEIYIISSINDIGNINDQESCKYKLTNQVYGVYLNDELNPSFYIPSGYVQGIINLGSGKYALKYSFTDTNEYSFKLKDDLDIDSPEDLTTIVVSFKNNFVNELENNCWKQVTFSKDDKGYYEVLDRSEVDKETMYIVFDFENKDSCKDYRLSSSKDAGAEEFLTKNLLSYFGNNNYITLTGIESGSYVYKIYNDKNSLIYNFSLKFNIPQSSEVIDESWKTYTLENDFDIKSTNDNKISKNGVYTYVYLKGNNIIKQVDYWFDKSIGSISGGDTLVITDSDINNKYPDLNGGRIIYSKYIQTSTSSSS